MEEHMEVEEETV